MYYDKIDEAKVFQGTVLEFSPTYIELQTHPAVIMDWPNLRVYLHTQYSSFNLRFKGAL